ncbi:MAG: TOPRIM nucleotidyl transferase/hydrolase domain-containing protein, partial [Syntrophobacter sp.]
MKFILLVEGHTEKIALPDFFKRWLDPRLKQRVGIQFVRF